ASRALALNIGRRVGIILGDNVTRFPKARRATITPDSDERLGVRAVLQPVIDVARYKADVAGAKEKRLLAHMLDADALDAQLPLRRVGMTVPCVLRLYAGRHGRAADDSHGRADALVGDQPAHIHLVPAFLLLQRRVGAAVVRLDLE